MKCRTEAVVELTIEITMYKYCCCCMSAGGANGDGAHLSHAFVTNTTNLLVDFRHGWLLEKENHHLTSSFLRFSTNWSLATKIKEVGG